MTSFQLPAYTAPAAGWHLADYKPSLTLTAKAGSDGTATATADPVDPGYLWVIQRAVVSTTSTSRTTSCRLYDGPVSPANMLSGTDSGNYDEADYPGGLIVDQSRQLTVEWAGLYAGDACTLRLQIAVLSRSS